jgi:hypothetical protein
MRHRWLILGMVALAACGGSDASHSDGGSDPTSAGQIACDRFRSMSADASSKAISASAAQSNFRSLRELAAQAEPEIREAAVALADDATAAGTAALKGDSNASLDAMTEICNQRYPP